jgi:hypothetical protein
MISSGQVHLQIRKPEMRQVPNVNRRLDDQTAIAAEETRHEYRAVEGEYKSS